MMNNLLRAGALALALAFTPSALAAPSFLESTIEADAAEIWADAGATQPRKDWIRNLFGVVDTSINSLRAALVGFVAVGDGSTNTLTAMQAYHDALPAGGVFNLGTPTTCYRTTGTFNITKALVFDGKNARICHTGSGVPVVKITASNVIVRDLRVSCSSGSFSSGQHGVYATGTFNAGTAPTYIERVIFHNLDVEQCGNTSMRADYVNNWEVSGGHCRNMGFACVMGVSTRYCRIHHVFGEQMNGDGDGNAFGVSLTRETDDAGNLTSQPRSSHCTVDSNVMTNALFQAFDTHCGEYIVFSNNVARGQKRGVNMTSCKDSSGTIKYAPRYVSTQNNVLDSGVTDGSADAGLHCDGASNGLGAFHELAICAFHGDTVIGHGSTSAYYVGAAHIEGTIGFVSTGVRIEQPAISGWSIYANNWNFNITGGTVIDAWAGSGGVYGSVVASEYNTGKLGGMVYGMGQPARSATITFNHANGVGHYHATDTNNQVYLGDMAYFDVTSKTGGTAHWAYPTGPIGSSGNCFAGMTSYDASYKYVCTATNTWEKVGIAP